MKGPPFPKPTEPTKPTKKGEVIQVDKDGFNKSVNTNVTYSRHRGTNEIREHHTGKGTYSIISPGSSEVIKTKANKGDWVPSTKEGKNL